jgi:hypothetical protein
MARNTNQLIDQLNAPNYNDRRQAAYELEKLGDPGAADALIEALKDENDFVRMAAARALGKVGNEKTVQALLATLNDDYYMVRQNAVWSLGELGTKAESALPELEKLKGDTTIFRERENTFGEIAEVVVGRIQVALMEAQAAEGGGDETSAEDAGDDDGKPSSAKTSLSADERKAKREAMLARIREKKAAKGS